jgi:hypothetical protein
VFRYCIPTDNHRLEVDAEVQFFDNIDPNGGGYFSSRQFVVTERCAVAVILIFTKFESREAIAFKKLIQQCSAEEALHRAAQQARDDFDQTYLSRFQGRKFAPKEILYLKGIFSPAISPLDTDNVVHEQDMDKDSADCSDIIESTTKALEKDTLKWLLVTVQQTNLRIRIQHMFQR